MRPFCRNAPLLFLLVTALLTGCGTAHSLSDLDEKSAITYTGLDGTYQVVKTGHLPFSKHATLLHDNGPVKEGDTLYLSTDKQSRFSMISYAAELKDKTAWVFRLHKVGGSVVMAWYGENQMNFVGKPPADKEPVAAPVFAPVYLLRFEAFGNPLNTIKVKAYKHDWLVEHANKVDGVDAITYHRHGNRFQTINGSPKSIEQLLALAEKDKANALGADDLLTLKRTADLPTKQGATKQGAKKQDPAPQPKPQAKTKQPAQAALAGASQQEWAERFKAGNADKVKPIITKQTPLAIRVRVGDKYAGERDPRWQLVADKARRAGYTVDMSSDRGIEVWVKTDVEFLVSGNLKWTQFLTTTLAFATVDGVVMTTAGKVSHRRVGLGLAYQTRCRYYTPEVSKDRMIELEKEDDRDDLRRCMDTLLNKWISATTPGVPLGELQGDLLTSYISAAEKVLTAKPRDLSAPHSKPKGVRVDGVMPDFTGLGLMLEQNNRYLEERVGKVIRNNGVPIMADNDARSPQVHISVLHDVTNLARNVEPARTGYIIARLREPSCLVTAADGTPVWVTATAATRIGMDNYDIARSGRYGLSLIAEQAVPGLLKD